MTMFHAYPWRKHELQDFWHFQEQSVLWGRVRFKLIGEVYTENVHFMIFDIDRYFRLYEVLYGKKFSQITQPKNHIFGDSVDAS